MDGLDVGPDPGDDRPHGAPGDPHQLGHRGLRAHGGQPRDLLIEHVGVPGGVPGPRHRSHRGSMLGAAHPRRVGLQLHLDRTQVQSTPPPASLSTVIGRRPTPTPPAPGTRPRPDPGAHMRHQDLLVLVELDMVDDRLLDPQQGAP
jgi:hypothetical protein